MGERQAGNAIAALKAKLATKARVKRDGKWVNPEARELGPGDAIRLRLGDIVPADARLLEGDPIEVDESALTGESLPATRKSGEAIFSGSIVRRGEIGALVYATGAKTYFGKTAELVQGAKSVSHFQRAVLKIGNYLILLAGAKTFKVTKGAPQVILALAALAAKAILNLILDGRLPDLTHGARYFQNPKIVASRARAGTVSPQLVNFGRAIPSAVIGEHSFYVGAGGGAGGSRGHTLFTPVSERGFGGVVAGAKVRLTASNPTCTRGTVSPATNAESPFPRSIQRSCSAPGRWTAWTSG